MALCACSVVYNDCRCNCVRVQESIKVFGGIVFAFSNIYFIDGKIVVVVSSL